MAGGTLIGLDIGSVFIRAVETTRGKEGVVITNAGRTPVPAGAVSAGIIVDERAVTQALKNLWSNAGFRTRDVIVGITNPQSVVREMSVTNLPMRELRKALPFQVRDVLPLPVERALLDFYPLEDPGQKEKVRGLLIAAPKDAVRSTVQPIERARLHVVRVDLGSLALLRALSKLDSTVEAIVYIGADVTSVVVHLDGVPLIVRSIPRGGQDITTTIANRLATTTTEAESLKRRIGVNLEEDVETAEVVRDALKPLLNEIRTSFMYLSATERGSRVARIALTGGGSLLPGLGELLAEQLSVEVITADPLARVREIRRGKQAALDPFRFSAAVPIGLTLGAA